MTTCDQLIVLRYTKIKDTALVIHAISRDRGRRSYVVHLGKGTSLAMFQPLSVVEADISDNPKSELSRARNFTQLLPLISIREDPRKNSMVLFLSEVLYRSIKDGSREDGLFEWCAKSIATLEELQTGYANYHLLFLLQLAGMLGFAPSSEGLAPFAGERLRQIQSLLGLPFAEALLLPLSGRERSEICDSIIRYISHHSESALDIRSLRILHELL